LFLEGENEEFVLNPKLIQVYKLYCLAKFSPKKEKEKEKEKEKARKEIKYYI
jgi:hypothetical protein